ncbi:MAG: hypothetical protein FJX75_06725 [Armatimonadetes bacterium]|nr:hypothetical protein [Armatimonadota bacterium]
MDLLSVCVGGAIGILGSFLTQFIGELAERKRRREERHLDYVKERLGAYARLYAAAWALFGKTVVPGSWRTYVQSISDALLNDAHLLLPQDRAEFARLFRPLLLQALALEVGNVPAELRTNRDKVPESATALCRAIHFAHAREAGRYAVLVGDTLKDAWSETFQDAARQAQEALEGGAASAATAATKDA